uniref:Uncharacterized protein n=1 Tax=Oryza nivara TaxID=4536 RepID=A0A0E0I3M2_ORYNI
MERLILHHHYLSSFYVVSSYCGVWTSLGMQTICQCHCIITTHFICSVSFPSFFFCENALHVLWAFGVEY